MLSKPLRTERDYRLRNSLKKPQMNYTLTYDTYYKNNVNFKKYKLPQLKIIIKEYNLPRTGNKNVLIERIVTLFFKMQNSSK